MSNVEKFLRDVGYFCVGTATVIVEAGGKAVKALVRKGEKTLRENQDTVDELKRKAKDAGEKIKDAGEKIKDAAQKVVAKPESAPEDTAVPEDEATTVDEAAPVDTSAMSAEERAELRRQLDEADAAANTQPAVPDAIYHTEEPVPAGKPEENEGNEAPEDTING